MTSFAALPGIGERFASSNEAGELQRLCVAGGAWARCDHGKEGRGARVWEWKFGGWSVTSSPRGAPVFTSAPIAAAARALS